MKYTFTYFLLFALFSVLQSFGQGEPVIVQAASGTLGTDFTTVTDGGVQFVRSQTNFIAPATRPNAATKVITYNITFPQAGVYELYMKVRVGPLGADDDSFYYTNGFGTKDPSLDDDWIIVNNISSVGFSLANEYISGDGVAAGGVWKWINLSEFNGGGEPPISFTVEAENLTQVFQIGGREDGLDIAMLAFAPESYFYTPSNLDNGQAGVLEIPDPEATPPIADGKTKWLGNVYSTAQVTGFKNYWNQVTPENAGKWGSVEGTRDVMNWTGLDNAYNLAKDNGFPFRMHVMLWGNQQPAWIENLPAEEQIEEIREWFAAVAERYPDIEYVEIVNEPINDPPRKNNDTDTGSGNYFEALGGDGETGWDWIITAFELGREFFPDAKLMINEYNILHNPTRAQVYKNVIQLLIDRDIIDGIGLQGHAFTTQQGTATTMQDVLDLLADTGLPIQITEMDIDGSTDRIQLLEYQRVFPILWEHPAVEGITLWGYRPGLWRTEQQAYIIDEQGVERPAMVWLRAYVNDTFVPINTITVSANAGTAQINTKGGTLQLSATIEPQDVTLSNVVWSVNNTNIATISPTGLLTAKNDGSVTVTVTSQDGSGVSGTLVVVISNQQETVTAIADITGFRMYPNPAVDGRFTVEGLEMVNQIKIMDVNGRAVKEIVTGNRSSVDVELSTVPAMYFVKFMRGKEFIVQKVLMK